MPRVTVAVLAYYGGGLLTEAIASALAQTYTDIKVVVYDDCSPYDLKKEVDAFHDPRLYYVRNEKNLGVWGNTNKAMDLCDTEYLHTFHGDDVMFSWMLDECVSIMDDNSDIGIVSTSCWFLEGSYPHPTKRSERAGVLYRTKEYIWVYCKGMYGGSGPLVSSTVLRKDILHRYNLRYGLNSSMADFNFFFEANHFGVSIYLSKIPLVAYRKYSFHRNSQTDPIKKICGQLRNFTSIRDFLMSLDASYVVSNTIKEQHVIASVVNLVVDGVTRESLNECRCIFAEEGLNISDETFLEAVSTGAISRFVRPLGTGKMSLGDYLTERQSCLERGLQLSLEKELQYFRMYIMPRRIAKAMPFAAI
ncbi:MAG: glycosyltransferase family 2 protein [Synergistaceae bacterium]|nr:glycosyltransferase family 2 protein [Synergistaceae bacterium]